MEETIFVQIAAYRDSELIPTVKNCLAQAEHPERLHISIGWQHSPDENVDEIANLENVTIVSYPHTVAKGPCWIRRAIQEEYKDETYTLQLDSHHRFIKNWDTEIIAMYKGLIADGVKKPIISSYLPSYEPKNDPANRTIDIWQVNYDRFIPEGPIFQRPSTIKNWETLTKPVPARTISAHFLFTRGQWIKEVPYDSQLYFHGEEITLAVRSYTHGYDLFHPHKIIAWHQYTREGQRKHWDDSSMWNNLNMYSYARVKMLLGIDGVDNKLAKFEETNTGLGTERTLSQFERYAGVEFKTRKLHKDTVAEILPPINFQDEETFQKNLCSVFKHCLDVFKPEVPLRDYTFWAISFQDRLGNDLYRQDADLAEIERAMFENPNDKFAHIWREFSTNERPYKWVVWPYSKSKDWLTDRIETVINYGN